MDNDTETQGDYVSGAGEDWKVSLGHKEQLRGVGNCAGEKKHNSFHMNITEDKVE